MPRQTRCIDCNSEGRLTSRAALRPGPRCEEHWHARKRKVAKAAHGRRLEENYDIDSDTYDFIYQSQGGRCFGCGKATGKARRLAVDHDHKCLEGHDPKKGCRKCIRALLCGPCNQILGRLDVAALLRLVDVLEDPPAQRVLGRLNGIGETK